MTTTVHVSRTFRVDTDKNPEVLEELRLLAARGFEVLGPIDLTPVSAPVEPEPEPEPSRPEVAEIIEQICRLAHLKGADVAALIGVTKESVYNWKNGNANCPEKRLESLQHLLERCQSLPEASRRLKDEAAGAKQALKLVSRRARRRRKVA